MKKQNGYTSIALIFLVFWMVLAAGWIMNIIELVHTVNLPINGMFIFRAVGVFVAPLGGILGWF